MLMMILCQACVVYRILLTILVIVVFAEKSFSTLKLIKIYLYSTMLQDRLNGLHMLSIEKKMLEQLNYVNLIDIFVSARRIIFN